MMPIDSQGRWGPKTAQDLKAYTDATFPPNRLTFVTSGELEEIWKIITGDAQEEINDHADLDLQAGDIPVDPGSFQEQLPASGPIVGVGISQAVNLPMRIK